MQILWTNGIFRHSCIHVSICFELLLLLCTWEKPCQYPMLFLPFVQQNSYSVSFAAQLGLFIFKCPSLGRKTLCLILNVDDGLTPTPVNPYEFFIQHLLSQRIQNTLPRESMRNRGIRCCPDCHRIGKNMKLELLSFDSQFCIVSADLDNVISFFSDNYVLRFKSWFCHTYLSVIKTRF